MAYKEHCRQTKAEFDFHNSPHPEFLPHPDDIVIDERTMEVSFNGPRTPDELTAWKAGQAFGAGLERQRDALIAEAAANPRRRAEVEGRLEQLNALILASNLAYPAEQVRRQPGFSLEESRRSIPANFPRG